MQGPSIVHPLAVLEFLLFNLVVDMALKGPGVYEEYMRKVVTYWRSRIDFHTSVAWSSVGNGVGGWTEEERRLHSLISNYIRRKLKVEGDVKEGSCLSMHTFLEDGATKFILEKDASEQHAKGTLLK